MNNFDIHPTQAEILCSLLASDFLGFSELNKNKTGSDLFSFHLRQLADWKLIEKNENGKYRLTANGKEYANRFDTNTKELERQPKVSVCIVGVKKENEQIYYLCQQRLKQPYFGFWGFVGGKVRWGERTAEVAVRELMEETGLLAKLTMVGLRHKMDYSSEEKLLEDKYFLVFRADEIAGELTTKFEGGANKWMTRKELLGQDDIFDDVEEIMVMVEKNDFYFEEKQYKVKRY